MYRYLLNQNFLLELLLYRTINLIQNHFRMVKDSLGMIRDLIAAKTKYQMEVNSVDAGFDSILITIQNKNVC